MLIKKGKLRYRKAVCFITQLLHPFSHSLTIFLVCLLSFICNQFVIQKLKQPIISKTPMRIYTLWKSFYRKKKEKVYDILWKSWTRARFVFLHNTIPHKTFCLLNIFFCGFFFLWVIILIFVLTVQFLMELKNFFFNIFEIFLLW